MAPTTRPTRGRARLRVVSAQQRTAASSRRRAKPPPTHGLNEVHLIGRLAAPITTRTLPSGDEVATWRLIVPRGVASAQAKDDDGRRRQASDTIDCQAWASPLRVRAGRWSGGEVIEVRGELRRRFWRGPAGPESRCEVEVVSAVVRRKAASAVSSAEG